MTDRARPRSSGRCFVPIGLAALVATLLASLLASPATSSTAMAATTATATRPSQATTGPRLELAEQRLAVDPNGDVVLRYSLTGLTGDDPLALLETPETEPPTTEPPTEPTTTTEPTTEPPTEPTTTEPPEPSEPAPALPTLTVEVTNYPPLTDPRDVERVVGSDVDPDTFRNVSGAAIDGVGFDARPLLTPNDDGTVDLALDIETDVENSIGTRLKLERPGVYPLRVQLKVDDVAIATAGTVIQRIAGAVDIGVEAAPPIDLAVVTVTPGPPPDADEATLDLARAQLDSAVELAATIDAPVTLEVPPTLVAEAAATAEDAERLTLALADDELVALPIVPLDVSSAVAADRAEAYTRLLGAGEDLLTDTLPTTSSRRDVWITTDPLSAGGAQHLRDLGTRFVVITPDLYESSIGGPLPPTDLFVEAVLPDGGTLPFLVVDPLAAELTTGAADRALARSTGTEWAVATLAELLVEQIDDDTRIAGSPLDRTAPPPRRSRILTTPTFERPDPRLLLELEELAATTPAIRFAPASTLVGLTDVVLDDGEPLTVRLPEVAGPPLDARAELIDLTRLEVASTASMLPEDDERIAQWSAQLDTLISTGYDDDQARALAAELVEAADSFTAAVQLPEPFTFTLTGRSGTIEVRIGNTLDEPLDVVVALDSNKVTFPDGDQQVTLRPLDETSVIVPVEAESNGTSSINLVVSTPAGEPLGDEVTLTARVTALTGLGQVLTGGLVLVLLTWWFTHWRSRRRAELAVDGRDRHPSARPVESAGS